MKTPKEVLITAFEQLINIAYQAKAHNFEPGHTKVQSFSVVTAIMRAYPFLVIEEKQEKAGPVTVTRLVVTDIL